MEAEEHGSKDRGATCVMKTGPHANSLGAVQNRHHQGPFGSPLPPGYLGRSGICCMHGQECIA